VRRLGTSGSGWSSAIVLHRIGWSGRPSSAWIGAVLIGFHLVAGLGAVAWWSLLSLRCQILRRVGKRLVELDGGMTWWTLSAIWPQVVPSGRSYSQSR
jgi:hypothetical protein